MWLVASNSKDAFVTAMIVTAMYSGMEVEKSRRNGLVEWGGKFLLLNPRLLSVCSKEIYSANQICDEAATAE